MGTKWWEIQIQCQPSLEEMIYWRLDSLGCRGTAGERQGESYYVYGYCPQTDTDLSDLDTLSSLLSQDAKNADLSTPVVSWRLIDDEDWANSWKQFWQPQEVGDRLLVYPAWLSEPEQSDRLVLRLDPGVAFGTGTHQTTQLCLEALEMRLDGDPSDAQIIADIGCGSGILSIAALLLGAKQVFAVDTDTLAVEASRHNRELNGLDPQKMVVEQGSLDHLITMYFDGFDGIVCNILADTILTLIPQLAVISQPTSWAILSGILTSQIDPIATALEQYGWTIATIWKRGEWCCFNVRRQAK